jgi:hypothetical protein
MKRNLPVFALRTVLIAGVLGLSALVGCTTLNDPNGYGYGGQGYGNPGYYGGPGYGSGPYYGNQPYYNGNSDYYRREQRELERERRRLEEERERLERERQRAPVYAPPPPPPPRPSQDTCPPGFSPSERKCTPEERRRGCRDIRMSSGLGCVDRR